MARRDRYLRLGLMMLVLSVSNPAKVFAATPIEQVKKAINQVLRILQDLGGMGETDRREMLRQALSPRFDFKEMARIALGKHWNSQTTRQQEFVAVFTDFIENSYFKKIESLKDTSIIYAGERVDGNLAQVDTRIIPRQEDPIPINYKLHLVEGEWKIYDMLIENISLADNYRSQFNRILTRATFDDLLKKLQQKVSARGG